MNIRDLEYLVALAEHRHFQRAAEACNVSQPTLSAQISKLESELGLKLLERTTRKVRFTYNGLQLVEQTRAVLRELNRLKSMAISQKNILSGPLHIGIIPTLAPYLIPHISPIICQKFPETDLSLHEAQTHQLLQMLESGKIECAIMPIVRETGAYVEIPLFDEPLRLAVPKGHPFAQTQPFLMEQLKGQKVLMLDQGDSLRWQVMRYCYQFDAQEDTRFIATNLETLKSMVAFEKGITFMPLLAALDSNKSDNICYLKCHNPEPKRTVAFILRNGDTMKNLYEILINEIVKCMKGYIGEFEMIV
ncbi:DNA-binding transcriptional regulator OxyR [Acerihabitans sp. TG2]|uniref:DNA-binding transcriptional regulator OxyR n=1 Tax=Acerihabitans sp. TG2 TaxID=3096008 RepID=UPI002B232FFC|nr:DNA-binding transcriptional regulator OxyR [Acerihabitans sp. TG2]MEA9389001.1 DNA-binding transcriptional regulator OxyR [Acerihabitans sp. TG2]